MERNDRHINHTDVVGSIHLEEQYELVPEYHPRNLAHLDGCSHLEMSINNTVLLLRQQGASSSGVYTSINFDSEVDRVKPRERLRQVVENVCFKKPAICSSDSAAGPGMISCAGKLHGEFELSNMQMSHLQTKSLSAAL